MEYTEINHLISLALAGDKCDNHNSSVKVKIDIQIQLNLSTNSKTIQKDLHLRLLHNNLRHRGDLGNNKRISLTLELELTPPV
jgi:hypothetical protein